MERRDALELTPNAHLGSGPLALVSAMIVAIVGLVTLFLGDAQGWAPFVRGVLHLGSFAVVWYGHRMSRFEMWVLFLLINVLAFLLPMFVDSPTPRAPSPPP